MLRTLCPALACAFLGLSLAAPAGAAGPTGLTMAMLSAPKALPQMDYKRLPRPPLTGSKPQMVEQTSCVTEGYVGKRFVADDAADAEDTITRAQLPQPSRVLRPGDMATMDYHPNRLNLMLDENDVVIEAKCG